jgi:hypothetical protein
MFLLGSFTINGRESVEDSYNIVVKIEGGGVNLINISIRFFLVT